MEAVHVRTYGMHCGQCTQEVERILSSVDGVAASIAVQSLKVTSVLYDPMTTTPKTIAKAIRSAGFEAEVVQNAPAPRRAYVA